MFLKNDEIPHEFPDRDYDRRRGSNKLVTTLIIVCICIVLIPSIIITFMYQHFLFAKLKLRPSVTFLITCIIGLILTLIHRLYNPIEQLLIVFSNFSFSMDFLRDLFTIGLFGLIFLWICIGIFFGLMFVLYHAGQLKKHPEMREMKGWAKDFTYRRTPWAYLKRRTLINNIKSGKEHSFDRAPLGVIDGPILHKEMGTKERKFPEDTVSRYYSEAKQHSLITGGTGSGKTLTALNMVLNDILAGYPVCYIDFKKSPEVIYFLSKWAKENNRPFYHFTSGRPGEYKNPLNKEQASYDPLSSGTSTSKADMMLNLRNWDGASEIYKNRTQDILQSLFYLLDRTEKDSIPGIEWDSGGLAEFISALEIENIRLMIEEMIKDANNFSAGDKRRYKALSELYNALSAGKKGEGLRNQIDEMISNCRTLIMSSYGDWLAEGQTSKHINLLDVALDKKNEGPVVLFSFNPQEEPDFAKYMGSIIMSDLGRVSAIKNSQGNKTPFGLYCDEFQVLDPNSVTDLLEKSRSAQFFITLTLQSLEQVVKASPNNGEATLESMIDTCSNFYFHGGATTNSAEKMSAVVGKYMRTTFKTTTEMSSHLFAFNFFNARNAVVTTGQEEDWIIPPFEFQRLELPREENKFKANAYVLNKSCSERMFAKNSGVTARRTQMIVCPELAAGAPDDFKRALDTTKNIMGKKNRPQKITKKPIQNIEIEEKSNEDWLIEEYSETNDFNEIDINNKFTLEKEEVKTSFDLMKQTKQNTRPKIKTKHKNSSNNKSSTSIKKQSGFELPNI